MTIPTLPRLLCLLLFALAMAPVPAPAGTEHFFSIAGKKVVVKDNANPAKRKAVFVSKDPALDFTAVNAPTQSAMYVRFTGGCAASSVYFLGRTRWTEKAGTFVYKDPDQIDGPVTLAIAKPGQVKVVAKGSQLDLPLINTGPQQQMTVIVETQETAWTAFFGPDNASIKKDDPVKGIFAAANATPAPSVPISCGGAFVE